MARVLADDLAKEKIVHAKSVVEGPFLEQINHLKSDFGVLKDPGHWDGNAAHQYHDLMSEIETALQTAQTKLGEFVANMGTITTNILVAGGNG
jgi:hypothetical protein